MNENDDLNIDALLAGRKMLISDTKDGLTISFDEKGTGRSCGGCTLCCKLLPVPTIDKPDNQRCQHQRSGKGCAIYAARPVACQAFVCRWLADPAAAGMPRPDRAHYVMDPDQDTILMTYDDGETQPVCVLQVWVDPAFPDAWDTPPLRAYMLHLAEKFQMATIIRFSAGKAMTVFPPPIAHDRQWHYETSGVMKTKDEIRARLAEMGNVQTVTAEVERG
jgi:hypothetical protein